jgi:hypothetical protein
MLDVIPFDCWRTLKADVEAFRRRRELKKRQTTTLIVRGIWVHDISVVIVKGRWDAGKRV